MRHTAHRVASARYGELSPDGGGGYPTVQTWDGVPPPVQNWDVVLNVQTWDGVPSPIQNWDVVLKAQTLDGLPPIQTWDGVPSLSRPGMGYAPSRPGMAPIVKLMSENLDIFRKCPNRLNLLQGVFRRDVLK